MKFGSDVISKSVRYRRHRMMSLGRIPKGDIFVLQNEVSARVIRRLLHDYQDIKISVKRPATRVGGGRVSGTQISATWHGKKLDLQKVLFRKPRPHPNEAVFDYNELVI